MKEFDVTITETLKKTVTVMAETQEEAENKVQELWNDGVYALDEDNFSDVFITTDKQRELSQTLLLIEPGRPPKEIDIDTALALLKLGGKMAVYPTEHTKPYGQNDKEDLR